VLMSNREAPELDTEAARRACMHVVRFMSTIAMDPHLNFEQKWTAEIAAMESRDALLGCLGQLVDWVDAAEPGAGQIERLNAALEADDLWPFGRLRQARLRE